jgi:hypothetical protein
MNKIKYKHPLLHVGIGVVMLVLATVLTVPPSQFGEKTFTLIGWVTLAVGLIHLGLGVWLIRKRRAGRS